MYNDYIDEFILYFVKPICLIKKRMEKMDVKSRYDKKKLEKTGQTNKIIQENS